MKERNDKIERIKADCNHKVELRIMAQSICMIREVFASRDINTPRTVQRTMELAIS